MNRSIHLLLVILALGLGGCTSLSPAPQRLAGDQFCGKWEGRWVSDKHANSSGKLKCELSRVDATHYRATFKAYWLAFHGTFPVMLETRQKGNVLHFVGSHELSKAFGGVYRYVGYVTPEQFISTYDSSYDTGRYEMKPVR